MWRERDKAGIRGGMKLWCTGEERDGRVSQIGQRSLHDSSLLFAPFIIYDEQIRLSL